MKKDEATLDAGKITRAEDLSKVVELLKAQLQEEVDYASLGFMDTFLAFLLFCFVVASLLPDVMEDIKHDAHKEISIIFFAFLSILVFLTALVFLFRSLRVWINFRKKKEDTAVIVAAADELKAAAAIEEEVLKKFETIKVRAEELNAKHHRDKEYFDAFQRLVAWSVCSMTSFLGACLPVVILVVGKGDMGVSSKSKAGYIIASVGSFLLGLGCSFLALKTYLNYRRNKAKDQTFALPV